MTNVKLSSTLCGVLPRVDRVARRHVVFGQKKIGMLTGIAQGARMDVTDRKVLARYARQTFRRARELRDRYELSDRAASAMVLIGFIVGAPIGFAVGLMYGGQYIGLLAAFFGLALSAVVAISMPFFAYYSVAYLVFWWNLARERRKFLEGLEGV